MIQLKNTHTTSVQIEYRIAAYVSALSSQHAAFFAKELSDHPSSPPLPLANFRAARENAPILSVFLQDLTENTRRHDTSSFTRIAQSNFCNPTQSHATTFFTTVEILFNFYRSPDLHTPHQSDRSTNLLNFHSQNYLGSPTIT